MQTVMSIRKPLSILLFVVSEILVYINKSFSFFVFIIRSPGVCKVHTCLYIVPYFTFHHSRLYNV